MAYFFNNVTLPTYLLKLKHCGTITNVALFIESHLATLKANNGNKTFLPHLDRLLYSHYIQSMMLCVASSQLDSPIGPLRKLKPTSPIHSESEIPPSPSPSKADTDPHGITQNQKPA